MRKRHGLGVLACTGALLGLLSLSACATGAVGSTGAGQGSSPRPPIAVGAARLDPEHEDVVMPLGEFQLSPAGSATLRRASDALLEQCAGTLGFDVDFPEREPTEYLSVTHFSFGVWTAKRASDTGYGLPLLPAAGPAFEADLATGDAGRRAAVQSCASEGEAASLNDGLESAGLASGADSESWLRMESDPRSAPILEAHRACMAAQGLQIGDDWAVEGIESMSTEQKTAAAILDVGCNRDSHFVDGLADIAAAYQQQFIELNRAALMAEKDHLDRMLARAEGILADTT